MRIIIIPHWLERIRKESDVRPGDLLDIKKLLSILSVDDVCFYMLCQEFLGDTIPRDIWDEFAQFPPFSIWKNVPDDKRQELVDRCQILAKEHANDDKFAFSLLFDGPGTDLPADYRSAYNGRVNFRLQEDLAFEGVHFAIPVTSPDPVNDTLLSYAQTLHTGLSYSSPLQLASLNTFKGYEKVIRTKVHSAARS